MGKTGLSCARFLSRRGEKFMMVDSRTAPPELARFQAGFPGVKIELGKFREATFRRAAQLMVSPGIGLQEPVIVDALNHGVPVTGDIDQFSKLAKAPIVAVTGSNGKSTVVSLVAEICEAAGVTFGLGGNLDGVRSRPALDLLEGDIPALYILELSSFQLETTAILGAEVAVILNLSEDHMDRYSGLRTYLEAKQRIFIGARKVVVNRDSPYSRPPTQVDAEIIDFGLGEPGPRGFGVLQQDGAEYLVLGRQLLARVDKLKVFGQHNVANVLAAMAIGKALGLAPELMAAAALQFRGLPDRCQWVAEIDGIEFYNDSKGTNVGATVAAVEGLGRKLEGKIVLIAGGVGKGANFQPLVRPITQFVRGVILVGEAAPQINEVLAAHKKISFADSMEDAVAQAKAAANPGDAVLLSPACASFDMFRDFHHRGQVFTETVRVLQ